MIRIKEEKINVQLLPDCSEKKGYIMSGGGGRIAGKEGSIVVRLVKSFMTCYIEGVRKLSLYLGTITDSILQFAFI